MYKVLFVFLFSLLSNESFGQDKVEWDFSFDNESSTILVKASIAEGWHLYSQHIDNEIGPVPTSIEFMANENFALIGNTEEPESLKEYDENFEGELNFFKDEVVFKQKVEVKQNSLIEGVVTFMICNDTMCLPPTDKIFELNVEI